MSCGLSQFGCCLLDLQIDHSNACYQGRMPAFRISTLQLLFICVNFEFRALAVCEVTLPGPQDEHQREG